MKLMAFPKQPARCLTTRGQNTASAPQSVSGRPNIFRVILRTICHWGILSRKRSRRELRLRETLSLGERRFVAVVEYENSRFLIGGGASSVGLLTRLADRPAASPVTSAEAATES